MQINEFMCKLLEKVAKNPKKPMLFAIDIGTAEPTDLFEFFDGVKGLLISLGADERPSAIVYPDGSKRTASLQAICNEAVEWDSVKVQI